MADDKDKDQQKYSYRPDINYQDTYESDFANKGYGSVQVKDDDSDNESIDIINSITNTFNEVSKVIPLLPADLQTVINGVYKPVLDTWANLEKRPYPKVIPDPDKVEWKDPDPKQIEVKDEGSIIDPIPEIIPTPSGGGEGPRDYEPDNDGMWDIDPPIVVKITTYDPIEIIQKEYIKNIADLFNYYVNRLKDIIYHYHSEKVAAVFAKKIGAQGNLINKTLKEAAFLLNPITDNCSDIDKENKHLFDASLSMGEISKMKLQFLGNACPVEQTLFHLKNFKAIYCLRVRYTEIEAIDGSNKINAMSNNILKGMKASYDQKYDVAFANLYRYLNSSLDILEDVLNTELAGLKARRTLIEKGGIK